MDRKFRILHKELQTILEEIISINKENFERYEP